MENEKNNLNNDQKDGKFLNKIGNKLGDEDNQTNASTANLNKVIFR